MVTTNKQTGVEVQLTGEDSNIFNIIGIVGKAMKKAGFREECKAMVCEVMGCSSYDVALVIIGDYVEVL